MTETADPRKAPTNMELAIAAKEALTELAKRGNDFTKEAEKLQKFIQEIESRQPEARSGRLSEIERDAARLLKTAIDVAFHEGFVLGGKKYEEVADGLRAQLSQMRDDKDRLNRALGAGGRDRSSADLRRIAHLESELETLASRIKAQSTALLSVRAENADLRMKVQELERPQKKS